MNTEIPNGNAFLNSQSDADIAAMSTDDIQKLLFDLHTHQIELKMQNMELSDAHHDLTLSRDDYAQLYDLSPVSYLTLNESGDIQKANIAAAALLGCSKQQLINQRFGSFIHPSDQDNYYLFIRSLLVQKKNLSLSAKLSNIGHSDTVYPVFQHSDYGHFLKSCTNSNLLTHVEFSASVVYEHNQDLRIFLIINDVTERKLAQDTIACLNEKLEEKIHQQTQELTAANLSLIKKIAELTQSRRQILEREVQLNSIFNASVEGIITIDLSGIIVSTNATVKSLFGYETEQLIGLHVDKIMHLPPLNKNNDRVLSTIGQIKEIVGLHKNGSELPLDLSTAEFTIDNRHYLTHIVRDVSVRKQREQKDKEHLNELAHVTRLGLMGEMAAGIAHEVNQPLTAVSAYTQVSLNIINTKKPDLEKLSEILYKTQQQAIRAGQIMHRMRAFVTSREKHISTVHINTLIHNAVSLYITELQQNGIELIFELENNLPLLYVDHIQIEQVLINLIRNSTDALQDLPSTEQRNIIIQSSLVNDNAIQIKVLDNGPGLNKEQQQKILMPFYTTKPNGMGMGLSISRSLIEAHQGTLHFSSQPGEGTTFYFTLPLSRKPDEN
jgi:PAS domain S-box-containing protein